VLNGSFSSISAIYCDMD